MIVRADGSFESNSLFPNTDWYNEGNYVMDETNKENASLIEKIKEASPYMDLVIENGQLVDVIPTEKPPIPEPEPQPPSATELLTDYIIDVDYRVTMIELGL